MPFATVDSWYIEVSEDAYQGDAKFYITNAAGNVVNWRGTGADGLYTVTASHATGEWQQISLGFAGPDSFSRGDYTIHYINDAYGGTPDTDRNLYIKDFVLDTGLFWFPTAALPNPVLPTHTVALGEDFTNTAANGFESADPHAAVMVVNGTASFHFPGPTIGVLNITVSQDAWNGNAEFYGVVDGFKFSGISGSGPNYVVTASHAAGQTQTFSIYGDFSPNGPNTVEIHYSNDAWGGTADTDRNLYVESVSYMTDYQANPSTLVTMLGTQAENNASNGATAPDSAVMSIDGTVTFHNTLPPTSTVVLHLSEDAFNGDAQFVVAIDGVQQGGIQTVTASHGAGQVQDITLTGNFGTLGPSTVDLTFLNDVWGGSAAMDRNLYVESLDVNGIHFQGNTATNNAANGAEAIDLTAAVMAVNGLATFHIDHTAPPELMG